VSEYHWLETLDSAIDQFVGELPNPDTKAAVFAAFEQRPAAVIKTIAEVADDKRNGKARSGWGILRKRLEGITHEPDAIVRDERDRLIQTRLARTWIDHAGVQIEDEAELLAVLFAPPEWTASLEQLLETELTTRGNPGRALYEPLLLASIARTRQYGPEPIPESSGPLAPYDSPELRQTMVAYWQERRTHERQRTADRTRQSQTDARPRTPAHQDAPPQPQPLETGREELAMASAAQVADPYYDTLEMPDEAA
jgi:hypothetical protein